ncbi:hypothetical protein J7L09_01070 [bacterium]|nr:hypothetical protein [bacterium]
MAIVFLETKNRKKYFYILALIGLVALLVFIVAYYGGRDVLPTLQPLEPKKLILNLKVLEHPVLQKLELPTEVPPLGEELEIERENPFTKYTPPVIPTTTPQ